MLNYIKSYLVNKQFAVKISNALSVNLEREKQSTLRLITFSDIILINYKRYTGKYSVNANLFADNFNF